MNFTVRDVVELTKDTDAEFTSLADPMDITYNVYITNNSPLNGVQYGDLVLVRAVSGKIMFGEITDIENGYAYIRVRF